MGQIPALWSLEPRVALTQCPLVPRAGKEPGGEGNRMWGATFDQEVRTHLAEEVRFEQMERSEETGTTLSSRQRAHRYRGPGVGTSLEFASP